MIKPYEAREELYPQSNKYGTAIDLRRYFEDKYPETVSQMPSVDPVPAYHARHPIPIRPTESTTEQIQRLSQQWIPQQRDTPTDLDIIYERFVKAILKADVKRQVDLQGSPSDAAISQLLESLSKLQTLPELVRNSNLFEREIEESSLEAARNFVVRSWFLIISHHLQWHTPHVTTEGEGDVQLEWWHGDRALLITITASSVDYLRVWGHRINEDMEEGDNPSPETLISLWQWLYS